MNADKEAQRLKRLNELGILDTSEDRSFRELAAQALKLFPGTSIAAVTLVDSERQWCKSIIGADVREIPRDQSFCTHTIETPDLMVVEDASKDPRFESNPLVKTGPKVRFYAGVKLMSGVGALCVIGPEPRKASESELEKLRKLAHLVDIQLMAHGTLHALS